MRRSGASVLPQRPLVSLKGPVTEGGSDTAVPYGQRHPGDTPRGTVAVVLTLPQGRGPEKLLPPVAEPHVSVPQTKPFRGFLLEGMKEPRRGCVLFSAAMTSAEEETSACP